MSARSDIAISQNDKRSYRFITLPNKLQATLIHDPDTEKSAACVDVRVGSMSDPANVNGLAHFLEHMLFMGTEKYPVENAYSQFLSAHGGFSNAYTAQQDTVYYFDVQNPSFEEALDMFASFFTCPLFNEDSTAREINAVDNENTKNLQSDTWRAYQLLKSLAIPTHPFSYFSTGNAETLRDMPAKEGIEMRKLLLEFYHKHYSANLMKLVVYGKESLDVMQQWVEQKFSAVPNSDLEMDSFPQKAYEPGVQLSKVLEMVPVKDTKAVDIYFTLPAIDPFYLSKPTRVISHLVGHESDGSILSALKRRGWANSLSSGDYQSIKEFGWLCISVSLSEEGFRHVDEVIACVFAYIDMLRSDGKGTQQWIADEVKNTADLNFRFVNKTEPSDYATKLANNMQIYPVEHIITGSELVFNADTTQIPDFLGHLVIENSLIIVKNRSFTGQTTQKERWYGTDYNLKELTAEQRAMWVHGTATEGAVDWRATGELYLPQANPFIPTEFALRCEAAGAGETGDADAAAAVTPQVVLKEATVSSTAHFYASSADAVAGAEAATAEAQEPAPSSTDEAAAAAQEGDEEEDEEDENEGDEGGAATQLAPLDGESIVVWHKMDTHWKVPKTNVIIKVDIAMGGCTPAYVACTDMFSLVLQDVMNEFSYYADCAGLHYDVSLGKGGWILSFYGYQHKLPVLIEKTCDSMRQLADLCTAELFARIKEKKLRDYANYLFWQPYQHCMLGTSTCLEEPRWTSAEKHAALKATDLNDFQSFCRQAVKTLKTEMMVHGNATAGEAVEYGRIVANALKYSPLPFALEPIRRLAQLQPGQEYTYRQHSLSCNPAEKNSAIQNMYLVAEEASADNCSPEVIAQEAILELVAHLLTEPAFDQLRTKEQLGYIVHTSKCDVSGMLGVRVIVQSNSKDGHSLNGRIEAFLELYRDTLLDVMSLETLETYITATVEQLLEKPKNLNEETGKLWAEINNSTYLFSRKALKAAYLKTAVEAKQTARIKQEVQAFYGRYLLPKSQSSTSERIVFSSQFYGEGTKYPDPTGAPKEGEVIITQPTFFKRSVHMRDVKTVQRTPK